MVNAIANGAYRSSVSMPGTASRGRMAPGSHVPNAAASMVSARLFLL